MSLATWKAEFYPVEAKDVKPEDALDHSIRKWEGLRVQSLRKHGLKKENHGLATAMGDRSGCLFLPASQNCALCAHYKGADRKCQGCPLAQSRGGLRCDVARTSHGETISPWHAWAVRGVSRHMLVALRRAKKWVEEQRERGK